MKKEFFSVATQDSQQNKGIQSTSNVQDKTENGKNFKETIRAVGPATEPPPP
ncbi:MAG: hypothetical protein KME64_06260 [Scytonematopsis contorta HA4267-MV1]|jgi:hypothetical protein|nr:hypothetical protein [Scytonematopsis contorta HA4267-MV1]